MGCADISTLLRLSFVQSLVIFWVRLLDRHILYNTGLFNCIESLFDVLAGVIRPSPFFFQILQDYFPSAMIICTWVMKVFTQGYLYTLLCFVEATNLQDQTLSAYVKVIASSRWRLMFAESMEKFWITWNVSNPTKERGSFLKKCISHLSLCMNQRVIRLLQN